MTAGDRVLVGFDGGPNGADALAFGKRWAAASGDELVVVTVHPGATSLGPQHVDAEWQAYVREEADQLLEEASKQLGGAEATYRRIDAGSASRGLHELVVQEPDSTPLVVVGARERAESRRTFPGTTADRLLHGTPVPVALVPRDYAEEPDLGLRKVLLAYVDTPDGRVALEHAIRIAQHLGASLRIVTVVPNTQVEVAVGEQSVFHTEQRAGFAGSLDAAVAVARAAGLEVDGELVEGVVHDVLADTGIEQGDLLVLGSRGYGPVRSVLLGGVGARVVRHARLPVVIVPRGAH